VKFENRNTSNRPEIEFTADVRARKLHFEKAPSPEVRFARRTERESDWHSERENLPDEVREGAVYRNARVRLLIASETVDNDPDFLNGSSRERIGTNLEYRGQKTEEQ
jgi:hypothetical protein